MTSPFQSIKDMVQHQPNSTPKPANDLQARQSLDDMIAGMFARRSANHVAASIAQANQSAAMGSAPSTGTCRT